ncbi:hypothetical protein [Nonomuraea zeae]|uniref:Uncharacterized protein n=1 Tax=Nonomuraea zeae TaxID=1642303 RepID=A0A5S4H0G1_9ACTN|nr:hypothetical protein [Nonomuraea zeae]TMR38402.1 hypothetical protein ETD85_04665 [Nonomuraea zeae]
MSTTAFSTAVTQARDLLRWRSPLRTELWAARLTAALEPGEVDPFLRALADDGSAEARLTLAALAAVNQGAETADVAPDDGAGAAHHVAVDAVPDDIDEVAVGAGWPGDEDLASQAAGSGAAYVVAGRGVAETLPGWVRRMGRVVCDGAWYGKADPYGEQALAVLSFHYENGKEPHLLVVGIDQVNGGLAVDALVEEVKFLDDLDLGRAEPGQVAGRVLDAFESSDRVMGAVVADTLPAVRPLALSRARAVPGITRQVPEDTLARFDALPELPELLELPGAREAFEKLAEFVGDRPLWWSPGRVSQFLTSWLPREAILSDAAVEAMPEVVRAWSRFCGGHPAVLRQIDEDAPRLPALMADDSLAGLGKRIAQSRLDDTR